MYYKSVALSGFQEFCGIFGYWFRNEALSVGRMDKSAAGADRRRPRK